MKVLQIVTAFTPAVIYGGPSAVAAKQAGSLARRGHRVTVATSNVLELKPVRFMKPHESDLGGVEVRYFPSRVPRSHFPFVLSRRLARWLADHVEDFDVVHIHFAREWIPVRAAQIAIGKGVPTFLQPHGMLGRVEGVRGVIDRLWVRRILEEADGVFSLQQHEDGETRRVAPHARTLRLPNGIDPPTREEPWTVDRLAKPVVLFLARLHPRKRVLEFVKMACILRDGGISARYRVVGPDGGDMARARRLVREYGLEDVVTFAGSLEGEAVIREYLGSAVYVLPAVNEPFPMSVLEALSLGVPTIVTDTCFTAPMLAKYGAALVSRSEAGALADSVTRILRDPALAKRLSGAGRNLVRQELSVARMTELLEEYYDDAIA